MVVFDPTLDFEPVAEQNNDPIVPEERFVFELIGLERSEPDQWRKNGGIKWTWLVSYPDGRPFIFQDEHYQLFRTTGVNANGRPTMNLGTYAHEWASAMLGRDLGIDEALKVSELRGKKMSAQVVWERQKSDPKKKTIKLASLRHVPVTTATAPRPAPAGSQVGPDPSEDDIDRALLVTKLNKQVERLNRLDPAAGKAAQEALDASDLGSATLEAIHVLLGQVQTAIQKAMDD